MTNFEGFVSVYTPASQKNQNQSVLKFLTATGKLARQTRFNLTIPGG